MLTLSALQTQLVQAQPVYLQRYRPCKTHIQKSNIPRKARVSIPTAKYLQNNTHQSAKSNTFLNCHPGQSPKTLNGNVLEWTRNPF